jgi:hypothetical protein
MPGVPTPSGFIRPDPEPDPHLPTLKKTTICKLNDGAERRFPALCDYLEHYVSQGIVRDLEDLVENYGHLIGEIFFNWVATGQLGCLFAVKLSKKPRANRWFPIVKLHALSEENQLGPTLNSYLDAASKSNEAAAIIFPDIVTPQDIITLVNCLCADPSGRWYRTEDGITKDPSGSLTFIGLRWVLQSGTSVNYVLGFSDIDTMPQTRRSPFTALFLRITDEKRTPAHREDGRVQVHLADLDSTFHPQAVHDYVSEATKQTRSNQVESHLTLAARARVTFSIATTMAHTLCQPRSVILEKDE